MKRKRFLAITALSILFAFGVTTGCASSGGSGEETANANGEKVLVMGTSADYPPYEFYETAKGEGKPVGFDIDIAKALTEKLGYTLKVEDMEFNGIIPALQSKRIDFAMSGMTPTEERKQSVDFSQIYYDAKNTIISKRSSGLASYEDLKGKKIGVQLGSIQEKEAKEQAKTIDMTIEPRNKVSELVQEVKAGRLDAAIVEDAVAKGYVQNNEDLEFSTVEIEGDSGSAIAFPKGSPLVSKFDQALTELKDSGELDGMITTWFEDFYEK